MMLQAHPERLVRAVFQGGLVLPALLALGTSEGRAQSTLLPVAAAAAADSAVAPAPVDLTHLLGSSGRLRFIPATPEQLASDSLLARVFAEQGVAEAGLRQVSLQSADGTPLTLALLIPFGQKTGGTVQGYRVGYWPSEKRASVTTALPEGFIEVARESQDIALSEHFLARHFLTKDQFDVWPKYLLVQPKLLDKLELIIAELEEMGHVGAVRVLSGFRTPQYNQRGVCRRCRRARDSRHMYGDAADIFVDADSNGVMDDLDGDGKVTTADARYLARIVERVEAAHPDLVGGLGIYRARQGHGPFIHVDTRGKAARW
jgi:hypothetical protein